MLEGSLVAAAAATSSETLTDALADADARRLAAAALREAREALEKSAVAVRRQAERRAAASDEDKRPTASTWAPSLGPCVARTWACGFSHRGLEALLVAPGPLWRLSRAYGLGLGDARAPAALDRVAGRPGVADADLGKLLEACDRAGTEAPALGAIRAALAKARVSGSVDAAALVFERAGRPRAAVRAATKLLRMVLLGLFSIPFLLGLAELLFPSRRASREFTEL